MPYAAIAISPAVSVAANSTSPNLMAGSLYEYLGAPSIVEYGIVASAVGLLFTIMMGGLVICQDQEVTGANRYPIVPDDWIIKHAGARGTKLYITARNRTAGALTFWLILNITPVA